MPLTSTARLKNYTALDIGTSFKEVDGTWWIIVLRRDTKTNGGEERPVPGLPEYGDRSLPETIAPNSDW